jgi:hypothetical protein
MTPETPVTLVTGSTSSEREAAIAAMIARHQPLHPSSTIGIILEGISDGTDPFASLADNFPLLTIVRIAPGCPCCVGNLTMRVTLNRLLRHSPEEIYISLATCLHLDHVRGFFAQPPYNKLIKLAKELSI